MELVISKFSAVTTFNLDKQAYGLDLIQSYCKFWPDECILYVFLENGLDKVDYENIKHKVKFFDYQKTIPEYYQFCTKFKDMEKKQDTYRLNAFKFAYKVFAMKKVLSKISSNFLIWLDADIKTIKPISEEFLLRLTDEKKYMSYLGRSHVKKENVRYSENGFTIFNTKHKLHFHFWERIEKMYTNGELFKLSEWHDSFVFDVVRTSLEKEFDCYNINISDFGIKSVGNESHVFVASILGDYMDHKKGDRKEKKWSPEFINRYRDNND